MKKNTFLHLQDLRHLSRKWSNFICLISTFGNFPLVVLLLSQSAVITTVDNTGRFTFYVIFVNCICRKTGLLQSLRIFSFSFSDFFSQSCLPEALSYMLLKRLLCNFFMLNMSKHESWKRQSCLSYFLESPVFSKKNSSFYKPIENNCILVKYVQ